MRSASFTARSTTVQVLTGIALVLFCLVFLRFVTLTFADDAPRRASTGTVINGEAVTDAPLMNAQREVTWASERYEYLQKQLKRRRCGNDRSYEQMREARQTLLKSRLRLLRLQQQRQHETTVQQERQFRAKQTPELDETLRNKLGLETETIPIPIMQ